MGTKLEVIPLELSDKPTVELKVAAEKLRVLPLEAGGQSRLEIEGLRGELSDVEVRNDGERVLIGTRPGANAWGPWPSMARRITLVVPAHVRAKVRQDFGQLSVERLAGCDLELEANAGTIDLEQVRGRLRVSVDSGAVRGEGIGGTLDISSQAGSVKLSIDALDAGEHRVRTAMGSVKLSLAPSIKVKLEATTLLGSVRMSHPSTPDAEAVLKLSADLGAIRVRTGDEVEDVKHGDWPDWQRFWRDVAGKAISTALEEIPRVVVPPPPPPRPPSARQVPEEELRKVLELLETGKINAQDAERLIRAMGR